MSITWRGREVHNPWGRGLITVICMIGVVVLFALVPVMLVLHPFFRLFGLRGTIQQSSTTAGGINLTLGTSSFGFIGWR